ncbi:MAG: cell division protein ZapA [Deltaproteobacteria bacterium]|nr:cell division protein ZapA [Deltaproteobacteria bacterium]
MTAHTMQVQQGQRFAMNVLGVDLVFWSAADPDHVERAKKFIESQYENLKSLGRQAEKDQLLILLVMGIADAMLQSRQDLEEMHARLDRLLSCIEETENA